MVPAPRNIIIKDINTHAKERLSERGFTIESSQKIVDLSDFALRQRNGEQFSFYSKNGFATVDNDGVVGSAGALDDGGRLLYDEVMKYVQRSK